MEMLKEIMLNVSENKMHLVGIVALLVLYKTRRIIKFFIDEILHTKPLSEKLFQELHSKRMLGNIQSGQTNELVSDRRICIIGAGMSGLLAGIKLKKAGIPFVIYERAHDVGGTWLFNKYPGCGCDIMSHFYSYSFELNPNWSRVWVKRDEIFEYYQNIVEKYNLRENIEFNTEVVSAVFYKDQSTWEITTRKIKNGNFAEADNPCNRLRKIEYGESSVSKFNILMGATGQLNNPHIPENIKGLENFKGPQFHSARWDSSVDLTNKNVIFVGSGASAVQIVPELVDKVKTLTLLQRSPGWVVLKLDHTYSSITQWAFKNLPFVMKLHRLFFFVWMDAVYYAIIPSKQQTLLQKFLIFFIVHFYQERVLKSKPELRKTVMSNERFGCKRMLISDDWYTSLAKSNVKVIPEGVSSVTEKGVVTTQSETKIDGDVIVWATGFKADKWLPGIHVEVRNSKDSKDGSIVLSELWDKKPPEAFMGMTVPEFPNLFIIYGPNTNLNHSSVVYQSECQMEHIMRILHEMEDKGYKQIQVNKDIFTSFNETLQSNLQNTAFTSGCNSWYLHNGHVSNNWYGSCWDFWTTVDDIDIKSCYHFDGKQQS